MCRNDINVTIKIPMDGPDLNGRIYPKEVVQKSIDDFYVKKEQAGEHDYDMSMFFDIPLRSYCLGPNIQDTIDKIDFSTLSNIDKTKEEE